MKIDELELSKSAIDFLKDPRVFLSLYPPQEESIKVWTHWMEKAFLFQLQLLVAKLFIAMLSNHKLSYQKIKVKVVYLSPHYEL